MKFANNINTTSLSVSKTIVSPVPSDSSSKTFTFTVTVTKADGNKLTGTFGGYTFNANGETTVTTTGNQTVTISDLPQGATYSVVEATDNEFENTASSNTTGTLGSTAPTAAFTNTRKTGSLNVTKSLRGKGTDAAPAGTYTFPIQVTTSIDGTTYYVAEASGAYSLTTTATQLNVTNGTTLTIDNLPVSHNGTALTYKVEEVNPGSVVVAGYTNVNVSGTTVETVDNITVTTTTAGTATLVNVYERDKGKLNIEKTVTVNGGTIANTTLVDGEYSFTVASDTGVTPATTKSFTITISHGAVTEVTGDATLVNGKAQVADLPTGTYTVTEVLTPAQTAKGITFTASGNTLVTVSKDNDASIPTASFVNNIEVGSLKITKIAKVGEAVASTLTDSRKNLADGTYVFKVYTDSAANTEATKAEGTPVGDVTVTITNGVAEADAEVTDFIPGTYYVKETSGDNAAVTLDTTIYQVTVVAGEKGATVSAGATATATNTLPVGSLTVTKAIQSTSGEEMTQTPTYPITISVVIGGTTYYVQDDTGALGTEAPATSLTVTKGTDLTISNLPYGSYTVTETNPGNVVVIGYSYVVVEGTSVASGSATLDGENTTGTVGLVNVYTKGASWTPQVIKLLNDANYTGTDFSFVLTETTSGRTYTETVNSADAGSVSFTAIPYTVADAGNVYTYTITETNGGAENTQYDSATIYAKVTVTNTSGTLSANAVYYSDAEMTQVLETPTFKNYELGSLTVQKTVTGSYTATDDTFPFTVMKGDKYVTGTLSSTTYTYSDLSDTNPEYTVKAGNANKLTFVNLPAGTYVVTEGSVRKTGYTITTTYKVDDGEAAQVGPSVEVTKGETKAVEITNHYQDAELIIKKTISGVEAGDLANVAATITFTVSDSSENKLLDNVAITAAPFTKDAESAVYTATLKSTDAGAWAQYIVPDGTYTVTETTTDATGYTLKTSTYQVVAGATTDATAQVGTAGSVTLTGADTSSGEIDFTNTYGKLVDVDVTKTWGEGQAAPEGATIKVKLTATVPGEEDADTHEPTVVNISDDDLKTLTGLSSLEITMDGNNSQGADTTTAWYYQWTNLPKYDGSGKLITYSVSETEYKIDGQNVDLTGTVTADGYHLTVTNSIPTTDIKAKKNWPTSQTVPEGTSVKLAISATVSDGQGGTTAPEDVTITPANVTLDGIVDTAGNDAANPNPVYETTAWEYTWANLPKYDAGGKAITYTVAETEYKIGELTLTTVTADATPNEGFDFSFTNELPKITLTGTKTWATKGTVPDDLTIELYTVVAGDPEVETKVNFGQQSTDNYYFSWTTKTGNNWTYSIVNMPKYNNDGTEITYRVKEVLPNGSIFAANNNGVAAVTVDGLTATAAGLINTEQTTATGTKAWESLPENDITMKSATLKLGRYKGEDKDTTFTELEATLTGTTAEPGATSGELTAWTYTWDGLDKVYWDAAANEGAGTYVDYIYKVTESTFIYGTTTYTASVGENGVYTVKVQESEDPTDTWIVTPSQDGKTVTNELNEKSFEFKKLWFFGETPSTWPKDSEGHDLPITVVLHRQLYDDTAAVTGTEETVATYSMTSTAATKTTEGAPTFTPTDNVFKARVEKYGVHEGTRYEWKYWVEETASVSGYTPGYAGNYEANGADTSMHLAENEQAIVNTMWSYELPSTGGPGTTGFYVLGSILTLLALVLLVAKKRSDGAGID